MAIREQENHTLPIPNGWFAVEWSRELHEGDEFLAMSRNGFASSTPIRPSV